MTEFAVPPTHRTRHSLLWCTRWWATRHQLWMDRQYVIVESSVMLKLAVNNGCMEAILYTQGEPISLK